MNKKNLKIIAFILIVTCFFNNSYCNAAVTKDIIDEAKKIISDGLKNSDSRIRMNAIEAASAGEKGVFSPQIAELLKSEIMPVRFAAAISLGDLQYEKAKNQLRQLLKDPDLNVEIAAAYALCKLGEKNNLALIQQAAQGNDQTVNANAAMLLGKLKNVESLPILYKLKDSKTSDDAVTYNATEAIARVGDDKIYPRIWTLLLSIYADDRCMGLYALGALGGNRSIDTILTMLDDEVLQVRLVAAGQLGLLGNKGGEFIVLEYLNSPPKLEKADYDRCNVLAALAIGQIGSEKLEEHLSKLLKNDSPAVRLAAAKSVFMLVGHN